MQGANDPRHPQAQARPVGHYRREMTMCEGAGMNDKRADTPTVSALITHDCSINPYGYARNSPATHPSPSVPANPI
jgi:hypothetical protein